MFADWELIGVPHRVVIAERGLKDGLLEVQGRRDAQPSSVPWAEVGALMQARLAA
jgi:prolyl-tRNA synthetase